MTSRIDPALRAAACARLRAVAEVEGLSVPAEASYPDLVRALYQDSALPVGEIARIAGVTERCIYGWMQQGGWQRRNWRHARNALARLVPAADAASPPAGGGAACDVEQARATAESYARARHLMDVAAAAAADSAKQRAAVAEERAAQRAAEWNATAKNRTWHAVNRTLCEIIELNEQGARPDDPRRKAAGRAVDLLCDQLEWLQEQRRGG